MDSEKESPISETHLDTEKSTIPSRWSSAENEHDGIEMDEDTSDEELFPLQVECEICKKSFSGVTPYEQHLNGKNHSKMVKKHMMMKKCNNILLPKPIVVESDGFTSETSEELYCEVCEKTCSGYVPYAMHLKSNGHAKKLKQQKLKDRLKNVDGVLTKENECAKDNDSENTEDLFMKPFARCSTCKKEFSGPEPFHQHVKSATHKKTVQQSETLQKIKDSLNPSEMCENEDGDLSCLVCKKTFSGLVPYQQHMQSLTHKTQLEIVDLVAKMRELSGTEEDDGEIKLVCKECDKCFTDPKAFQKHLKKNDHEKLKAKDKIMALLAKHSEILVVHPNHDELEVENEPTSEDELNALLDSDYMICKICHQCFSGPESALDHIKSRKHMKIKQEMKKIKLLKQNLKLKKKGASSENVEASKNVDMKPVDAVSSAIVADLNTDQGSNVPKEHSSAGIELDNGGKDDPDSALIGEYLMI